MATKRIFIAGHGVVLSSTTEKIEADVTCFVNEGEMFNYYFTPGFIQAIMQGKTKAGFDINDLISEVHPQTSHQIETIAKGTDLNKHLLYLYNEDPYPLIAKGFHSTKYTNVCNQGLFTLIYPFIATNGPFKRDVIFQNAKFEARVGNPDYKYKLHSPNPGIETLDEGTSLNDDCILIWPKIEGKPTPSTESNYASLGEIITWAKKQYPKDECEFYWFACREHI